MFSPSVSARRLLSVVLVAALGASLVPAAFGLGVSEADPPPSDPVRAGAVRTASDDAIRATLAPSLRDAAAKGGSKLVDVLVQVRRGAGAPSALVRPLRLSVKADADNEYWVGKVAAERLVKLSTDASVRYVADNGRRTPPLPPDVRRRTKASVMKANAAKRAALAARRATGASKAVPDPVAPKAAPGGKPTGWYDIGPGHSSSGAWADGFTGDGVKVAVADDGLDFGHPDLQGTQAYNTDPASPYAGWPMAFDPFSTLLYAYDAIYGTDYIANGTGWFSSTAATMAAGPTGTFDSNTYTLPSTSKSGVYHIGYLWDENLYQLWYGRFPALLVSDENTAGVYDTVYVDLDNDGDFTNDKALTKADPISSVDFWDSAAGVAQPDGYADISGGMLYWIADGANHPPMAAWQFPELGTRPAPGSGDIVCMMGAYDYFADHGTLCGSNVAGQGVIDGESIAGEYPSFKSTNTWTGGGMVQGAGKDAGLVAISDIYNNFSTSTLMAYDFVAFGPDGVPESGDEIQVMSNSYGESAVDNDEWDFPSRYVTMLNEFFAPNSSFLFSTGNGGPGYGTNAPPTPSTGIGVGASTQFGAAGGWDSIDTLSQVTTGDVIPFSNRGPSAMGHAGPTIVADGAYSSGAKVLSLANGDGWTAWEIWGGTSRSCPVAAGNMTLIYDAFKSANGRWPTWSEARDLIASGATDLNYDTLVQGSGAVNAYRSARLAAGMGGAGVAVSPSSWYPGSFRGDKAPGFAQIMHPGETDSVTLRITNPSAAPVTAQITDSWLQRTRTTTISVTLDPAELSAYDPARPDWITDITSAIDPGTDLAVIRAVLPLSTLDPDSDYVAENRVRLLTYDWTDRNGDLGLWDDTNENGFVNTGELDVNEYMRFTYANSVGTSLENRVQRPLDRMHSGVMLGLAHQNRNGAPVTVQIEVSCWSKADMPMLATAAGSVIVPGDGSRSVTLFASVPDDAPLGVYEGQFRIAVGPDATVVPVHFTVAGTGTEISYGGAQPYEQLMDQGRMFGYTDWNWRAEAGDWRFYATDVPDDAVLPSGALWLARTTWDAPPTDIDTLLYGPSGAFFNEPSLLGPYDLGWTGGSPNTNTGAGVWRFDTATGGPEDWVTGHLTPGLNQIQLHNVLFDGSQVGASFSGQTGVLSADPLSADIVDRATDHTVPFTFSTSMDLPGFQAEAFGLSKVEQSTESVAHHGWWYGTFDVTHAASIEVGTRNNDSDIDLYLQRWNGATWVTLGSSESGSGNEWVKVNAPSDGQYRMAVYGYDVPGGTTTFTAVRAIPQGADITLSGVPAGAVAAGSTFTIEASLSKDRTALADRDGEWIGTLSCGPTGAGSALQLPMTLSYPYEVDSVAPSAGATMVPTSTIVTAVFSKRVETSTLTTSTFTLSSGGAKVPATVDYDPLTATARLTATLTPDTLYTAELGAGIRAADGSLFDGFTWEFTTRPVVIRKPTAISFSLPATLRYGDPTGLLISSRRITGATRGPDPSAPVALLFQAVGASTWTTVTTGKADLLGNWRPIVTARAAGSYKAVRLKDTYGLPSESAPEAFGMALYPVLRPVKTRVAHGTSIRVNVVVYPVSVSKGRTVTLQYWTGSRWKGFRYIGLSKNGTTAFYIRSTRATTKRIRAVVSSYGGYGGAVSDPVTLRWY